MSVRVASSNLNQTPLDWRGNFNNIKDQFLDVTKIDLSEFKEEGALADERRQFHDNETSLAWAHDTMGPVTPNLLTRRTGFQMVSSM